MYMNEAIQEMVMALVVKRIGFDKESGQAWLGVDDSTLHPKYRSGDSPSHSDEFNRRNKIIYEDDVRYDFERATSNDGNDRNVVDGRFVYSMMILPMVTSFVHATSPEWLQELRQFSDGAEAWMDSVRGLGFDFFRTGGLGTYLWESARDSWVVQDEEEEDSELWWKAYDETRDQQFGQFMECLEALTRNLSNLIRELDVTFRNPTPESLGMALKRREWEHIALNYVQKEGPLAFLYHYGTVEEFDHHLSVVIPGKERENDAFMARLSEKWWERAAVYL